MLYLASTIVSAILVTFVSRLADRFGPRIVLVGAGFGLGAACFGMATATHLFLFFIAFAALRALGQGSLHINCVLLVNQWFVSRRGRAVGFMTMGAMLSIALFPSFARLLIDAIDWRGAYWVLGVVAIGLIVPVAALVVRNRPEDMGLFPDGLPSPTGVGDEAGGIGSSEARQGIHLTQLLAAGPVPELPQPGDHGPDVPPGIHIRGTRPERHLGRRGLRRSSPPPREPAPWLPVS